MKLNTQSVSLTFDDVLLLPRYADFKREETDVSVELSSKVKLKVPLLSSPMDTVTTAPLAIALGNLGGLGFIHRNMTPEEEVAELKKAKEKTELVGAAVGVGRDFEERVKMLVDAGVDALIVDSAHGETKYMVEATAHIADTYKNVLLIAGNIATAEGAHKLIKAGAQVLRIGMGPGSICTTRIVSGMGVPQLSAIMDVVEVAKQNGVKTIADGGIRFSGDIVKALAAGADTVMLGSIFAGTDEAPGKVVEIDHKKYKIYRGMGSVSAMKEGSAARYGQEYRKGQERKLIAEGVEGKVVYRGSVEDVVSQMVGGLRTGMYYLGSKTLNELYENSEFIKITQASLIESFPHDLT